MEIITTVFGWMNDQLLKMLWLNDLVGALVEDVFRLPLSERLGASVQFFLYDTVKIFVLLSALIFAISYVQSFFPPERTKRILGRFSGIGANTLGALLGTITPFCSCSSIPLFIGFTSAGLPIGVTFSFLISSPLVDLASVILLASIFNWKIAIAYVLTGLVLAVTGGTIISLLKLERYVEPFVYGTHLADVDLPEMTTRDRLAFAREAVADIVKRVWPYVLAGVGIGALIHGWIPAEWVAAVLGKENAFSVVIATLVGVPMYADIFGTLPIAEALVAKGVGIGTVLAFMMAVTALSLPSLVMLKKVVKTPLLATFFGLVVTGILVIGYAFNALGGTLL
jgi:hypothetical protein